MTDYTPDSTAGARPHRLCYVLWTNGFRLLVTAGGRLFPSIYFQVGPRYAHILAFSCIILFSKSGYMYPYKIQTFELSKLYFYYVRYKYIT